MRQDHQNVAYWLFSDESLFRFVNRAQSIRPNKREQARYVLAALHKHGITETPDGVKYTAAAIRAAL